MIALPKAGGVLDLLPDYHVEIPPGDCLIIQAGVSIGRPAARFTHPNIIAQADVVHWFKRYTRNGKRWSSRAGRNFYFAVPKEHIAISEKPGHSYVDGTINGVAVTFNVSGGTHNGWTDWIRETVSISVNHPRRDLLKIAEVALSPEEATRRGLSVVIEPLGEGDQKIFDEAAAKVLVLGRIKAGDTVILGEGFSWGDETELRVEEIAGRRILACGRHGGLVKVAFSQVAWVATLGKLGVSAV